MTFLFVFKVSVAMTVLVGAFMPLTWKAARRAGALATFWGVALLAHIGWLLVPYIGGAASIARWGAIMWLGAMLAATVLLIPFALLSVIVGQLRWRRGTVVLPATYAGCFALSGIILAFTSTAPFVVRLEDIRIAGLPPALDGFRIANLGDVHIGRFIDANELQRGIDALNDRHVDLLAITGDLVDDVGQLDDTMRVLLTSNARYHTVAILGNHERAHLARILAAYRQHKDHITLLVNESTAITHDGATLHIVGVDFPVNSKGDYRPSDPEQDAAMRAEANVGFAGIATGDAVIALSHNPNFFPFAAAHGAQLTLASHTHGGQLKLFGHPVFDVYHYVQGIYPQGNATLDVSAGFGHWLPIRFGVPREIVIDTLRRAR